MENYRKRNSKRWLYCVKKMKAYAIVIEGNEVSEAGYAALAKSSYRIGNEFKMSQFKAITPDIVEKDMYDQDVKWNYPWEGSVLDFGTGLQKSAYVTTNPKARMACAMSHFYLWQLCWERREPIIILEHDAIFVEKIDFIPDDTGYNIVGLNNPLGATRKSNVFFEAIKKKAQPFQLCPYVDEDRKIPQGLAGNSAYMIKPAGAEKMISLVYKHGMWPNDALMCKQLVDGLAVSKKFYTKTQKLQSTTRDGIV
jgi:GR25 family glycosyltransferase involved in LPS biosynthesis